MSDFYNNTIEFWVQGGWAMGGLALLSFILYGMAMMTRVELWMKRMVSEKKWRHWLDNPKERKGPIGKIISYAMEAGSLEEIDSRFNELRMVEIQPITKNIRFIQICVKAAPLVGLLGTVTGMLLTFQGISEGSGGSQTMEVVTSGISEALFTTAMGLVIALPGYFLHYHLMRTRDKYAAFLEHLESACMQRFYRKRSSNYSLDNQTTNIMA